MFARRENECDLRDQLRKEYLMRIILAVIVVCVCSFYARAQESATGSNERPVSLTETAVALDASGRSVLEATLRTTALNGAPDSPVTNIRVVVRNSSGVAYAFVSGLITFYDSSAVRCGEGIFKADALAPNEAFETDTPGIRIRCAPATWRIIANNLLPRVAPAAITTPIAESRPGLNLVISVDGEEHPLQLEKPMVLTLGNSQRTIVVRSAP
jgi:hypothetical protein